MSLSDFSIASPLVFEVPPPNKALEAKQQNTDTSLTFSSAKLVMLGGLISSTSIDYTFTTKALIRIAYIHFSIRAAPVNNCQTRCQIIRNSQARDILWYNHQQGASATEQYETYSLVFPVPLPFEVNNGDYIRFRCDGGSDGNYTIALFQEAL